VKSSSCILVNSDKLTDTVLTIVRPTMSSTMHFAMVPLSLCRRLTCGCIAQSVCEAGKRVCQSRAFVCKQIHTLNATSKSPLAWRTHDVPRVRTDESSYSHNSGIEIVACCCFGVF